MPDLDAEKTVEGQFVAHSILGGDAAGWQLFHREYSQRLLVIAHRMVSRNPRLKSHVQAEDAVQGFLAKILERPERMLAPAAKGVKPLWPRLARSLANFCSDLQRKLKHEPLAMPSAEQAVSPAMPSREEPADGAAHIADRIAARLDAIRDAHFAARPTRVPLCQILLLSERLLLAEQIARSFLEPSGVLTSSIDPAVLAERLGPWTDEEKAALLPQAARSLEDVLEDVRHFYSRPPYRVEGSVVADTLEIRRNTWDIWVRRARQNVIRHLGSNEVNTLFPHWPKGLSAAASVEDTNDS